MIALATQAVFSRKPPTGWFFCYICIMKNRAGIIAILIKLGPKVLSILAKTTKFALVGLSFAAYAYLYTWQFSVIILSMLIVHEYGHIWAMQRCGLKTKGIYLIPFVGGLAVSDGMAKSRGDEVFIAIMGPVFGLALSVLSLVVYYVTRDPLYAATASWMAMVNIFNLFPVTPLDGGRILKAITLSINNKLGMVYMLVALLLLTFATIFFGLYTFFILILIGGVELFFEYRKHKMQKELDEIESYKDLASPEIATSIDELIAKYRDNTIKMGTRDNLLSVGVYFTVLSALFAVMLLMGTVPGADLAMDMLR